MTDPFVGRLSFFRVYSGTLKSGSYVLNSNKMLKKELVESYLCMLIQEQKYKKCMLEI